MSMEVINSDPAESHFIKVDKIDSTLLREAVEGNELDEIERLLSVGADVNTRHEEDWTILHLAARKNQDNSHFDVIKILLVNGADVNAQNCRGETPLHLLVKKADVKTVKLLLDFGADIRIDNRDKLTPIFYAVNEGRHSFEIFKLLVDLGSSIFSTGINLATPLHWACSGYAPDALKVVKFILKNGADIETLDRNKRTPLLYFLLYSRSPDLHEFLSKYANFGAINFFRINRSYYPHHEFFWKKLLEHVAKILALGITVDISFSEFILNGNELNAYFQKCAKELEVAKSSKLQNCWVTYFNLLVDCKRKLKNYAGNRELIEDFKNSGCMEKFPIYGPEMQKNVEKGIKTRRTFDESSIALSKCLPKFNPNHLIIKDILYCNISYKNLSAFLSDE